MGKNIFKIGVGKLNSGLIEDEEKYNEFLRKKAGTIKNIEDVKKFITKKRDEYGEKGFDDYEDVTKLAEECGMIKEIVRCQFLLEMFDELACSVGLDAEWMGDSLE